MPRKQTQSQLNNLRSNNKRTPSEVRENARKGGIKSGESRRHKASFRDMVQAALQSEIPNHGGFKKLKELTEGYGFTGESSNMQATLISGAMLEGAKGNIAATKFLIEAAGEKIGPEALEAESGYNGLPARCIGREWVDINRSIDEREYSQYDFKGGRGSLKSSFCGLKVVDLIMLNPEYCALAVRQLKDNLKDSVYSQIVWAIDELGLSEQFKCTKNPMEIKRIPTGQVIYFRGADDPSKIKSLKPPKGKHIAVVWVEEADQIHGADALRNILQSAFRGGDGGILFRSYNTPISQRHFINVEERESNTRRFLHHSHYLHAPRKWLGDMFYEIAENLKAKNERAYRHEYDGEATGTGASVFENVTAKPGIITDSMVSTFDKIYCGLDFGYFPDPAAFVACYYDKARQKLYIYDEEVHYKMGNDILARTLRKWKREKVVGDSAEPKSIADLKKEGFIIYGAKKGPGSVEWGIKWLASLNEIIIDTERTPVAANEFLGYEYERTKDGEIISGYPDADNHTIDAVRYATEDINRRGVEFG